MRKALVIILTVIVLAAGSVLVLKRKLWQAQPSNTIAIRQKEAYPFDLRPAAIAKLQQLVLIASDSLYKLRIDSLFVEAGTGTLLLKGVGLYPDSSVQVRLHSSKSLPDDVFKIELDGLRITGIGLDDLIHSRDIHLRSITAVAPRIHVQHTMQDYNSTDGVKRERTTLFSRIKDKADRIAIDSVFFSNGYLIDHVKGRKNVFNEVSLLLTDILVDSAAEKDKDRVLFARRMQLNSGSIVMEDGDYDLGMGSIFVSGPQRQVRIRNFFLRPKGGREEAARRQKERSSIFTIEVPAITLKGVDWWAAVNGESIIAEAMEANDAHLGVYFDERVPAGPIDRENFPQQKLMQMGAHVSLKQVAFHNSTIVCEQFNKESNQLGRLTFNGIKLTMDGVSNIPAEITKQATAHIHASARFMNKTALRTDFAFDLSKNKRGAFQLDLKMGALDNQTVNTFSEAMGLVRFPSGQLQDGQGLLRGNNDYVEGKLIVRYTDLHMEPLKPEKKENGEFKTKHVTKKLANALFVKDNNPSRGELRQPDFQLSRTNESNFFSLVWEGMKVGLLKAVGIPPSLGRKKK